MAAEALESAASEMGIEIYVETQGSAGISPIDDEIIASADAAIFAADIGVRGRDRFEHLPIYEVGVKLAINQPVEVINEALARVDVKKEVLSGALESNPPSPSDRSSNKRSVTTSIRQWLMTGMSYAIPSIAVGGAATTVSTWFDHRLPPLTTSISGGFAFELIQNSHSFIGTYHLAGSIYLIGLIAMALAIPILSAFTAYAISDRPALIPGLIGGFSASYLGGGYLAGIVVGLVAGFSARWIGEVRFPVVLRSIVPTTITPIFASVLTAGVSIYVISPPARALNHHLVRIFSNLNGFESLAIGLAIGAMMAADLGGPINKVAYSVGILLLLSGSYLVMGAVIASGVVPPMGLAIAALVTPKRFTVEEKKAAPLSLLVGASLVSEKAIPFTRSGYRKEMIIAAVAGASVTGATSMALGVTSPMPHGGFFVFYLFGKPQYYALSVAIGTVITACVAILLRSIGPDRLVSSKA